MQYNFAYNDHIFHYNKSLMNVSPVFWTLPHILKVCQTRKQKQYGVWMHILKSTAMHIIARV